MAELPQVIVVDDEPLIPESWRELLARRFVVRTFSDPFAALEHVVAREHELDVALVDVRMPGMDGIEWLEHARRLRPTLEVIVVTGHGTIQTAVRAIQLGAYDFLCKPVDDIDSAMHRIASAVERKRLRETNARLAEQLAAFGPGTSLVGESQKLERVRRFVDQVADSTSPVLIRGESGTGKELVARAVHARGARRARPFVAVNCAAVAESLIDSELFGHERGAFTGALASHKGLFEAADGGVLFLDELGDVPAGTQVRLLRALQEGEIRPVGSTKTRKVDVRVVAATNVDLERAMREGRFREDLYYRISTFVVDLPPLRERGGDVPLLAQYLLTRFARRLGREVNGFTDAALAAMATYAWPGNVRELGNAVEYAVTLCSGPLVDAGDLPAHVVSAQSLRVLRAREAEVRAGASGEVVPYGDERARVISDFERDYLANLMQAVAGNLSEAARRSGIDRSNLRRLLRRHGLREDPASGLG